MKRWMNKVFQEMIYDFLITVEYITYINKYYKNININ